MVYCNLIRDYGDHAEYAFGATVSDMTGTLAVYTQKFPEIKSQPSKKDVSYLWIAKLYGKYKEDFEKGVFRDRIAYEC